MSYFDDDVLMEVEVEGTTEEMLDGLADLTDDFGRLAELKPAHDRVKTDKSLKGLNGTLRWLDFTPTEVAEANIKQGGKCLFGCEHPGTLATGVKSRAYFIPIRDQNDDCVLVCKKHWRSENRVNRDLRKWLISQVTGEVTGGAARVTEIVESLRAKHQAQVEVEEKEEKAHRTTRNKALFRALSTEILLGNSPFHLPFTEVRRRVEEWCAKFPNKSITVELKVYRRDEEGTAILLDTPKLLKWRVRSGRSGKPDQTVFSDKTVPRHLKVGKGLTWGLDLLADDNPSSFDKPKQS